MRRCWTCDEVVGDVAAKTCVRKYCGARDDVTRDEKKAQTRAKLIQAAASVFARRGFEAASLDDVAEVFHQNVAHGRRYT